MRSATAYTTDTTTIRSAPALVALALIGLLAETFIVLCLRPLVSASIAFMSVVAVSLGGWALLAQTLVAAAIAAALIAIFCRHRQRQAEKRMWADVYAVIQ